MAVQCDFPFHPRACDPADGLIAFLDESHTELIYAGLKCMNGSEVMNSHWFEFASHINKFEQFADNKQFPHNQLAAVIASKLYFYMKEYEDVRNSPRCMQLALAAGDLFTKDNDRLYVDKITSICLDTYTEKAKKNFVLESKDKEMIDEKLLNLVETNFSFSLKDGQFKECIGFALDACRLDLMTKVISIAKSEERSSLLSHALTTAVEFFPNLEYRNMVIQKLLALHRQQDNKNYVGMAQCCIHLCDPKEMSSILEQLVEDSAKNKKSELTAYQLAFDIEENSSQQFITSVVKALRKEDQTQAAIAPVSQDAPNDSSMRDAPDEEAQSHQLSKPVQTLIQILEGQTTMQLHLQFLIKNNHTDMIILKNTKDAVRNSIGHTATVIANGFMHAGTTCDDFLRDNLDWVSKATNWNKFGAVASLGVIHRRHEDDALHILEPYLPKENNAATTSGYMEGGGLYALGLIYANHGNEVTINYLMQQLEKATQDCVKHGACLGLGLAAMGSRRQDVYGMLKTALYLDDAVIGEAAGLAMGLVMLGSGSANQLNDMLTYAKDTTHEKIIRGLAMGMALLMFGRLENADDLIDQLCKDKEPVLRCSGVFTLAMAYAGTGKPTALRKLLLLAASDTSDDVKRSAASAIGMLFFKSPELCPGQVASQLESYNAHIRYGAAIALAIACAGTGNKEAISLLEPMQKDKIAYVRQGVFMAMAMIMIGHNEQTCPRVKDLRIAITKAVSDRHEDTIAKFGAVTAQGILDAGGRNVTIGLQTRTGHTDEMGVVGVQVFLQYWTWFPMSHFLSLSFRPMCLIGLNKDLKMPKMEFKSSARPSIYAYPPALEEKKDTKAEKVETAILSVTEKVHKKTKRKMEGQNADKMDVDDATSTSKSIANVKDVKIDGKIEEKSVKEKKEEEKEKKEEKKKEPEPNFEMLKNPSRVMKPQLRVMSLESGSRYIAIKDVKIGGVLMLADNKMGDKEELVEISKAGGTSHKTENSPEAKAPNAFELPVDSKFLPK